MDMKTARDTVNKADDIIHGLGLTDPTTLTYDYAVQDALRELCLALYCVIEELDAREQRDQRGIKVRSLKAFARESNVRQ